MEVNQTVLEADFEAAIDAQKEAIYRICRIYARAPMEPEDLFQEVVLQAWRSFGSFKGQSGIGTWLYRVALNVSMGMKHKHDPKAQQTIKLDAISFEVGQWDESEDERYEALRSCIDHLNESDRSLIVLYLEELSYKDIAQVLGLTENHVAVKMKRVRRKLFDCMTKRIAS